MGRKLLVAVMVALAASSACLGTENYTIVPWQLGAIVWVGTPPEDLQGVADFAAKAAQEVFEFWEVQPPTPAPNWDHPVQTSSEAWERNLTQETIKNVLAKELFSFMHEYRLKHGVPIREPNSDELILIPAPTWSGKKVAPLIIGIYPDRETMGAACGDYSFDGLYGPPPSVVKLVWERKKSPASIGPPFSPSFPPGTISSSLT